MRYVMSCIVAMSYQNMSLKVSTTGLDMYYKRLLFLLNRGLVIPEVMRRAIDNSLDFLRRMRV
jgi:hypothetical protein